MGLQSDSCVELRHFEGDSIWRTIFPMYTKLFRYNVDEESPHCNLLLFFTSANVKFST